MPVERNRPATKPNRKTLILLAAEKLFALHGYGGVSIRQIAAEAGVPLALVGYHFGPKEALFNAIFEHWDENIRQRLAALKAIRHAPGHAAYLQEVVDAFLEPVLRLRASSDGEWYALLMTRGLREPGTLLDHAMQRHFDPLAHAFIDALTAGYSTGNRPQAAWCYQFMLGALLHHLSDQRVASLSLNANTPQDPLVAPLLRAFILGGIQSTMTSPWTFTHAPQTS